MLDIFGMFFSKTWEFFQIKWPGFEFSIGDVFLAAVVTLGSLTAVLRMAGVSALGGFHLRGIVGRGGNNEKIKVSPNRKGDTK